jgi:hypothetical protein
MQEMCCVTKRQVGVIFGRRTRITVLFLTDFFQQG